jgi:DNA polymerase-3 subunit gamma/tau
MLPRTLAARGAICYPIPDMSYVVLARKWRPMRFEDLVGQDHVARILGNAIKSGRVAHAFLFTGVRGVGKTTSARILAKALNCMGDPDTTPAGTDPGPTVTPCLKCRACLEIAASTDVDVREIDGASYNGVDEVRKLQDSLPYRPTRDRYKIFIVDEVHMLSTNAWNAFLKTLEEPPAHVKFIFATTEVHKVPITILSRVQRFDFKLISAQVIAERLRHVLTAESIKADDAALSIVAREAAGSMRDAMSLLDQVIAWGGEELRGDDVSRVLGVASRSVLYDLARALLSGDARRCLSVVAELSDQGYDVVHVARDFLGLLRDLVVGKISGEPGPLLDLPEQEARDVIELATQSDKDDLLRLHQGFAMGFDELSKSGQPRAGLEMLLVRLARRPALVPLDDLVQRLGALERRLSGGGGAPTPQRERPPVDRPDTGSFQGSRPREPRTAPKPRPAADDDRGEPPHAFPAFPEPSAAPPPRPPEPRRPVERRDAAPDYSDFAFPEPAAPQPAKPRPEGPPPAPEPPAPIPEGIETFRAIVDRVSESRPELGAFLGQAALLELSPTTLIIAYPKEDPFAREVEQNAAAVRAAAEATLGGTVTLSIERDDVKARSFRTLARLDAEAEENRRRAAIAKARSHPRIADAIEVLGARLKDLRLSDG